MHVCVHVTVHIHVCDHMTCTCMYVCVGMLARHTIMSTTKTSAQVSSRPKVIHHVYHGYNGSFSV